jgi:Flagellar hook-length control protein FliK
MLAWHYGRQGVLCSMSAIVSALQGQLHELRAQNLATLLSAVEPVSAIARAEAGASQPQTLHATVIAPPQNGRVMIALAGTALELPLSAALLAEAEANPALFREGARLTLQPEPGTAALRLVMPEATPRATPATLVNMSRLAPGPSAEAAPPLPQVFQPGTPGAGVQRLTGLAFPLAEMPATTTPNAQNQPNALALPGRQIASALAMLPPQVAEAALYAASRQAPISPAITALLGEAPDAPLPARAQAALEALATSRLDATAKPEASTINRALLQSGVFLEASLAKGQTPASDLKSLLLAVKSALLPPESTKAEVPAPRSQPEGLRTRETGSSSELLRLVEGAVERIKLNQFASLPEHQGVRITDDRPQSFQLSTTIPLATQGLDRPQTAAIGLMIEHQPHADEIEAPETDDDGDNEAHGFPWKVRIALDLEETGPVQAEIGLRGHAVAVTLWAERKGTAALARSEIGALHEALTGAAFEVSRLEVKDGRPMGNTPRFTPALDRRT